MRVPWTPLSPSRRERTVRRAGLALGAAAATALLLAAIESPHVDPWLLGAALLAAAGGFTAGRGRALHGFEVGVDAGGRLVGRVSSGPTAPEQGLHCVFAAPWLITLRVGTMWIPVWPDSVPGNTFRRLWVHIRWSSGRHPVDLPRGVAPGQPT